MDALTPPDPPLSDGVVTLRPPRPEDAPAMLAARDDAIRRWLGVGELTAEAAGSNIARWTEDWAAGTRAALSILRADDGAYAGLIFLRPDRYDCAELTYELAPNARGQGFATRAVKLVARWAFGQLDVGRLDVRTDVDNPASARVAERAGFVREGVERSRFLVRGERRDCFLHSLLPEDLS